MSDKLKNYEMLLNNVVCAVQNEIQNKAELNGKLKMSGTDFEAVVQDALLKSGINGEQITHSPQKFPDFVITDETGLKVGVEVKKTDSDKWEVIGGSIYESLKSELDETYILMGKFGGIKPEARLKRYEECLQDLKVTHSPRFYLNMDIPEGQDYLTRNEAKDMLTLSGDDLNRKIRQLLRTNKSTWWSEGETTSYADLSPEEKEMYLNDGIALFPEVFGSDYTNFTPWLVYSCLVWCGNIRDIFSAGGVVLHSGMYFSAVMNRAIINIQSIIKRISKLSQEEIIKFWGLDSDEIEERISTWVDLVEKNLRLSDKLIKKNQNLARFSGMAESEIRIIVAKEFIGILREKCTMR